jgi:hypothetical protein
MFITQHSGQGKAYQVFYRGFDAVHGQDLEFWVGGAPVNEVSNIHGQGYADLHFVMPEVVREVALLPGNYNAEQGDFAVAGTVRYTLGYDEPGVTASGLIGSFGERRVFLAYHPEEAPSDTFAAFEAQSTDGFGPGRAASRTSGVAQRSFRVGDGRMRLLATGYVGRFDSPGVVRRADIDNGTLGRFDTYGVDQGGYSSRLQFVADYRVENEQSSWALAPYVVGRSLKLAQDYTGYLVDKTNGDLTQLLNESVTAGFTSSYRRYLHWFSRRDAVRVGVSVRYDRISQSQIDLSHGGERVLGTIVDAQIRALDAAGWAELTVSPVKRLSVSGGLRVDGLGDLVQDNTPAAESRYGSDPSAFARQLRPVSAGGQSRSAMGTHFGPRATVDWTVTSGLHALVSYGEGFRSPQARSLGDGEKTPFTAVRSMEAGLRYVSSTVMGTVSAFRTVLEQDLVFDAATTRNESVPGTQRSGVALEFTARPREWFVSSSSGTFTHATFTESDSHYRAGDKLPYVPRIVIRQDLAVTPTLGTVYGRPLTTRLGTALTGVVDRPQPYGTYGHNIFLVDVLGELRLREIAVGLSAFNLFDAKYYDSEFTYSANWDPGQSARLVPERYVTVGTPRTVLGTLTLYLN